jgi:hypothetical protein
MKVVKIVGKRAKNEVCGAPLIDPSNTCRRRRDSLFFASSLLPLMEQERLAGGNAIPDQNQSLNAWFRELLSPSSFLTSLRILRQNRCILG